MDNKKLEQLAQSDYFVLLEELLEEQVAELREMPYTGKRHDVIALDALSRQKAIKIIRDIISLVERSIANPKGGERRSFK